MIEDAESHSQTLGRAWGIPGKKGEDCRIQRGQRHQPQEQGPQSQLPMAHWDLQRLELQSGIPAVSELGSLLICMVV